MPRAIWSGTISFGLVSVPVKLYSALSRKSVRFHQLHASDHVRIQQKRICPADGQEVSYQDIVQGYELAPDTYVVIEPEDLAALEPRKTRTIDIEDFVELSEIDPIFYDHPYYLVPAGPAAAKAYRLLLEAMREAEKVALARVVLRSKEHLVAIRPLEDVLAMATMNFADEILAADRLDELAEEEPPTTDKRERDAARQLVESLSGPFEPDKYRDTYREAVLELIERKAAGKEIAVQPAAPEPPSAVPDLMGALQASLEEVRQRTGKAAGKRGTAKRTAAKPTAAKVDTSKTSTPKRTASKPRAGTAKTAKAPAKRKTAKA